MWSEASTLQVLERMGVFMLQSRIIETAWACLRLGTPVRFRMKGSKDTKKESSSFLEDSPKLIDPRMNRPVIDPSRLTLLSQNVQGLGLNKDKVPLNLMDQLQLEVSPQKPVESLQQALRERISFFLKSRYVVIEYTTTNTRRRVRFGIASYLGPLVIELFCRKLEYLEIFIVMK